MVQKIREIVGTANVFINEPLRKHCTFRIGGTARFFVTPTSTYEMLNLVRCLRETNIKWKVVGNCSNLLFMDSGYDGVIISTLKLKDVCDLGEGNLITSAGTMLPLLSREVADMGLSGLEFASGIPATVGGAIVMNAGAYGGCMSDIIKSVTYFNGEKIVVGDCSSLGFGYRDSIFKRNSEYVIMFCELSLKQSTKENVTREIERIKNLRCKSQPTGRSAGSVFKSIEGVSAGKIIDDCGIKGSVVGDAEVSPKHANFIINKGNATSKDVLELIELIRSKVNEKYNQELELEIEIVQ